MQRRSINTINIIIYKSIRSIYLVNSYPRGAYMYQSHIPRSWLSLILLDLYSMSSGMLDLLDNIMRRLKVINRKLEIMKNKNSSQYSFWREKSDLISLLQKNRKGRFWYFIILLFNLVSINTSESLYECFVVMYLWLVCTCIMWLANCHNVHDP